MLQKDLTANFILININTVLETPHIVVAAAIATKTGNPYLALTLALFSHFVLDEIPHWNPHLTTKEGGVRKIIPQNMKIIISDSTLALIAGSVIAISMLPNINKMILVLCCCLMAALPDLLEAPYIFLNYKSKFMKKWMLFQKSHQSNTNIVWGLATQMITLFASFWWIAH